MKPASGGRRCAKLPATAAMPACVFRSPGSPASAVHRHRGGRLDRRRRSAGRVGAVARKADSPGNSPGLRHRRRGRAAARSAGRRAAQPANSIRPTQPRTRLPRRQHLHQRQRVAQFPLRRNAPLGGALARGAGRWPRLDVGRGDAIDFDPGTTRFPPSPRTPPAICCGRGMDWVDLFVRVGRHARRDHGSARGSASRAARGARRAWSSFADDAALDAVDEWRSTEARMLEYLDRASLESAARALPGNSRRRASGHPLRPGAHFRRRSRSGPLARPHSGGGAIRRGVVVRALGADRERFRQFRHALPEVVNDTVRRSGALKMNTDYAVPLARNREMLAYYRRAWSGSSPAAT
jgi:hypothetical protein